MRLVLAGLGALLILYGLIALPMFLGIRPRQARSDMRANIDSLRTAELAYEVAFGRFLPASDGQAFRELGWEPAGAAGSAYRVVVTEGGFEVHGVIDADGDGVPAEYVATEHSPAMPATGPSVY